MTEYVVLPKCPVCLRHYSSKVKPMVLQPCSHGMCDECINNYRQHREDDEYSETDEIKCPKCREVVIEEKPNYDLLDMMPEEGMSHYWTEKLVQNCDAVGMDCHVHDTVETLSKLLVLRISDDARIQSMALKKQADWLDSDRKLVKLLKREFVDCILALSMDFKEATKWIQVLNFPLDFERYFVTQIMTVFQNKTFLDEFNAEWLMALIPLSV